MAKTPEMNRAYVKKHREKRSAFIREAKNKPCMDCKVVYPYYVMTFDHVEGKKAFGIARYTAMNVGLEKLKAEIAKCDVVCGNCHLARTWKRLMHRDRLGDRA